MVGLLLYLYLRRPRELERDRVLELEEEELLDRLDLTKVLNCISKLVTPFCSFEYEGELT